MVPKSKTRDFFLFCKNRKFLETLQALCSLVLTCLVGTQIVCSGHVLVPEIYAPSRKVELGAQSRGRLLQKSFENKNFF